MKLEKTSWIASILAIPVAFFVWYFKPEEFTAFFKSLGKIIWTPFSIVFNWLAHPVTWPVWALILLAISGLAIVAGLFYIFSRASEVGAQPIQLDPFDYRTDEIFGVQWVWEYVGTKLDADRVSAFCPRKNCKCRLKSQPNQNARYNPDFYAFPISLVCPNCGLQCDFDKDLKQLTHDVLIEVERRIRTGEFQQRMTQQ